MPPMKAKDTKSAAVPLDDDDDVEVMEDIVLSGDEEDDDDDVTLIVLKRPPVTERLVEEVEITDDVEITGTGSGVELKERKGFVKEFIEAEGAALIVSKELYLVLFHVENVWINGSQKDTTRTRENLQVGTEVSFYSKTFKGEQFKDLSEDKVLHQAVAVWTGDSRPDNVLRKISDEEYKKRLQEHRDTFLLYLRGSIFLRAALVRVSGEISNYINDKMGIIDYRDELTKKIHKILFHTDEVKIYRKDVKIYGLPSKRLLPVGCPVSVDARNVHIKDMSSIEYQAIAVLAGPWPQYLFPTLLPGGQGSVAPKYNMPESTHTFYYLEIAMEGRLTTRMNEFKNYLMRTRNKIIPDYENARYIQTKEDYLNWKREFEGNRKRTFRKNYNPGEKREIVDAFRLTQADEEEAPEPRSRITQKVVQERTWYTPEAWEHGGLRIKEEFKDESEEGTAAPKKFKMEK